MDRQMITFVDNEQTAQLINVALQIAIDAGRTSLRERFRFISKSLREANEAKHLTFPTISHVFLVNIVPATPSKPDLQKQVLHFKQSQMQSTKPHIPFQADFLVQFLVRIVVHF